MIDPELIPTSAIVDANIVFGAFGRDSGTRAELCREFFRTVIAKKQRLLIAAPTLSEVLRGEGSSVVPRMGPIEIVDFDQVAARVLGEVFPSSLLKSFRDETGLSLSYFKYDALIVACAVRHKASCIVTYDEGMRLLAARAKMKLRKVEDFKEAQKSLSLKGVTGSGPVLRIVDESGN